MIRAPEGAGYYARNNGEKTERKMRVGCYEMRTGDVGVKGLKT